jgi:3-(3-hydroxy-phenyl)propionate hydroxylase
MTTPSAFAARRSRGICYAQKSLEIFDRLGIYDRIREKGITWSVGRTFSGADEIYSFNLKDESLSEQPPFINLQQFYLEWFLVERIGELARARSAGRRRSSRSSTAATAR